MEDFLRRFNVFLEKHSLLVAALLPAFWMALFTGLFTPVFEGEAANRTFMTLSGWFVVAEPSAVFTEPHHWVASLVQWAYAKWPERAWWGGILLSLHWLGATGLLWNLLQKRTNWLIVLGFSVVACLLLAPFWLHLTTAGVATVLLLAGVSLCANENRWSTVLGGGAVILASLINFKVFILLGLPALLLFFAFFKGIDSWQRSKSLFVLLGAALLASFLYLSAPEKSVSENMQQAQANTALIPLTQGFENELNNPNLHKLAREVGWSTNDMRLALLGYRADPKLLGLRQLSTWAQYIPHKEFAFLQEKEKQKVLSNPIFNHLFFWGLLCSGGLFFWVKLSRRFSFFMVLTLSLAGAWAAYRFLHLPLQFQPEDFWGITLLLPLLLLGQLAEKGIQLWQRGQWLKLLWAVLWVGLAFGLFPGTQRKTSKIFKEKTEAALPTPPKNEHWLYWGKLPNYYAQVSLPEGHERWLWLGQWQTPGFEKLMGKHGFYQPLKDLIDSPQHRLFINAAMWKKIRPVVEIYAAEHLSKALVFSEQKIGDTDLAVQLLTKQ